MNCVSASPPLHRIATCLTC
uniref:Uncharacterized protein n=1 Tax=Arundo donax TaxID=35708 RepID=A0A0A8ZHM1_ARUDO